MNFTARKAVAIRPQKELKLSTFLIALLTASAFFVPYILMSEGYFTFYGDFNVQQIPFYQQCHQAIKEGNLWWSWTTDLGANFIGSYSFYLLGSPFFWVTLLFPNAWVPYLMGPLLILKFAFAALTAYLYIRRFTRTAEAARLGGLLYAFSGFSVYNIFFNHFHEAIIVFPLLLLGLELLITENRRFVFALMVCLCAVTNYFFFFGMVVFTVIYFFVRLGSKAIKVKLSMFFVLIFEAVLGLLLSSFLLLPSLLAVSSNGRLSEILLGWNALMYGKEQIYANVLECFFFPPDMPARPVFFPNADVKWSSLGAWLPLFSTVGIFTLFSKKKGHWAKRLLGICLFMSMVPILNSMFYAFNTAYYARWLYMPILILCLATVTLAEDSEIDWSFGYKWTFGITAVITLVIGFFPQKNEDDKLIFGVYNQGSNEYTHEMYILRFWTTCAIAIVGLVVLGLILTLRKKNQRAFFRSAVACVCIISVIYGNVYVASGRTHSNDIKEVMIDQLIEGEVDLMDDSEYRIDVYEGIDNTSMYLGIPGINAFHSVVPSSIMEFYTFIGVERSVASRPEERYDALRPLLSVKYVLDRKGKDDKTFLNENTNQTAMYGYNYVMTSGEYYVYENENYIPYGFSYDYYMDYEFCESYSEISRCDLMLKAILLDDKQIEKYGYMMKNIDGVPAENDEDVSLIFSDYQMAIDAQKLIPSAAFFFERDNNGFTAKVQRDGDSLVFFSVPYDEGWTATVNGEKAEIERVNIGFMAVKVEGGISEIRFDYTTPGLETGIMLTVVSAGVLLLYILIWLLKRNRRPEIEYPEGEALLTDWRRQEIGELSAKAEVYTSTLDKLEDLEDTAKIDLKDEKEGFDGGFKIDLDSFEDK